MIQASHRVYEFGFPFQEAPIWAPQVERWYQLDAYAYGLAQTYSVLIGPQSPRPDLILLASPEGSNDTDWAFAQQWLKTGVPSPSKFAHTLPNIRGSVFCQVMNWNGPTLCIQNDPTTLIAALREGTELTSSEELERIWILGVTGGTKPGRFAGHWFALQKEGALTFEIASPPPLPSGNTTFREEADIYLLEWLKNESSGNPFRLSPQLMLRRTKGT